MNIILPICSPPQPLQHPPAHTASFAQAHIIRQFDIGGEFQREGQHFDTFVADPFFVFDLLDFDLQGFGDRALQLFEQGGDLVVEGLLQEVEAFHGPVEAGVNAVVVVAQADPLAEVVAVLAFAGRQGELFDIYAVDAHGGGAAVELEGPVGLREEVVQFFDAFVEADQHGQAVILFVLDQGQAVVIAAGIVVVVVEEVVFVAGFGGHGAPESIEFPGLNGGVERNGKQAQGGIHQVLCLVNGRTVLPIRFGTAIIREFVQAAITDFRKIFAGFR